MTTPTTLAGRAAALRDELLNVDRRIRELSESFGMVDDDVLNAEDKAALYEVIDSLADARLGITPVEQDLETAVWHASKLGL